MFQTSQNWELFGFDVRLIGRRWRSAWREFLWGASSPVVSHLDEIVRLYVADQVQYFHADKKIHVTDEESVTCEAVLIPDDKVLCKTLYLPMAAEGDLDAVMAFEANAHSPFPEDDTASGWAVVGKNDEHLSVALAVASISTVMTYFGRQYECHDLKAYEAWVLTDEKILVLDGFGQQLRRKKYRRRLLKTVALLGVVAVLIVVIFGVAVVAKNLELKQYREMSEEIQRDASTGAKAKTTLVRASETISALNKIMTVYPNPHRELARLTRLLDDSASIVSFDMTGVELRLRGRAVDAAAVMQQLTEEPAYAEVSSPQAITKLGNSGFEQFYLDIKLAQVAAP